MRCALLIAAMAATGCTSRTTSTTPTPPEVIAPQASRMNLRVDSISIAYFSGSGSAPAANYSACYDHTNGFYLGVNFNTTITIVSANDEILVTTTTPTRWNGWTSSGGCGGFSIRDTNYWHPRGARYRLRIDYQYDDGVGGSLEKELPVPPSQASGTGLVINQLRTNGPRGDADQFIEIKNTSNHSITPTNVTALEFSTAAGQSRSQVSLPTRPIGPGCYLLIATNQPSNTLGIPSGTYSGSAPPDVSLVAGILSSDSGLVLRESGEPLDQVAMSAGSLFGEGTPLAPFGHDNQDVSYMRIGDTHNNARDFVRGPARPRNSAMCGQ